MKRICCMCKNEFPLTSEFFAWRKKSSSTFQSQCRECQKQYRKQHYLNNRQKYIDKSDIRRRKMREENTDKLIEYLLDHHCVDCGEQDPVVLQFDHLDPATKFKNISYLFNMQYWKQILKEISKCEVVCANCHFRRTAKRSGWRKYLASVV